MYVHCVRRAQEARLQSLAMQAAESDCTLRVTSTHLCSADSARAKEKTGEPHQTSTLNFQRPREIHQTSNLNSADKIAPYASWHLGTLDDCSAVISQSS